MKNIILFIPLLFLLVFISCSQDELLNNYSNSLQDYDFSKMTSYDVALEKLAFGIHESIKNDDFRKALRVSVDEGYTNDYDVPLNEFKNKSLSISSGGLDINYFFEDILYPGKVLSKSSDYQTFLDSISVLYPDLIISIPVNIELIDYGVSPYVLFIPECFEDVKYKEIRAINPSGDIEYLSLTEDPPFPVIVIRRMEGSVEVTSADVQDSFDNKGPTSTSAIKGDINLQVATNNAGVLISWIEQSDALTYSLYRYRHTVLYGTDSEGYELVTTFTNSNDNTYIDEITYSQIPQNVYYERYKMVVQYSDNSEVSYYAYANEQLSDIKIGDVASLGNKIIQVNWLKITTNVLTGFNVYRASSVASEETNPDNVWDNGWLLSNSQMLAPHLSSWTDYDSEKIPGKAYFYRVLPRSFSEEQDWTFQAATNAEAAKYINVAICSDRSDNAQLIATHIKTEDISQLEGWIYGKPEFVFAVFGYSSLNSQFEAQEPKRLGQFSISGTKRKTYNTGFDINRTMLLQWSNDLNMEIVAVVGYEHDDEVGGWDAIALKLKSLAIDLVTKTVQSKTGVDIKGLTDVLKSRRGDTYAGGAYIMHSGKETVTLKLDQGKGGKDQTQYPQGGVMLRISTNTSTASWQSSWDNDIIQLQDDEY